MKQIKIFNLNLFFIVDDEFFDELSKIEWRLHPDGYVRGRINGKREFVHRYIMKDNLKDNLCVDHINGDPLDNQRSNLRVCTTRQNAINSKKQKNTSSKYKGVHYCRTEKRRKRWVASLELYNKHIYLGRYKTEEEAALAYNKGASKIFGEFARLNQIT